MSEQLAINLEEEKLPEGPFTKESLEAFPDSTLVKLYKNAMHIDPTLRSFTREIMIDGLANTEAELERLTKIDKEDDLLDMAQLYER